MVEFHQQNNNFTDKNIFFFLANSHYAFHHVCSRGSNLAQQISWGKKNAKMVLQSSLSQLFSLSKFICRLQGLCMLGTIIKVLFGVPDLPKHIHCMTVWF